MIQSLPAFARLNYYVAVKCQFWYFNAMKLKELIEIVGEEPVFEAGLLVSGEMEPADLRRQLSRWTKRGNCALSCQGERISAMLWLLSSLAERVGRVQDRR